MNDDEKRAIVSTCLLAAFADGARVEREREEIERIARGLAGGDESLVGACNDIVLGRVAPRDVAARFRTPEARQAAYEMAVCVCNADGAQSAAERQFLRELHGALGLEALGATQFSDQAESIAAQPIQSIAPASDAELDAMILNHAILCAALEQLPQRLASLAIVPIQMRMVYKVGSKCGYALDKGHILDLLSTAGLGVASQLVDSFARGVLTKLVGRFSGSLLSGLAGRATSSAIAFGTTYALGHLAKRYYSGGRKLSAAEIRETFGSLVDEAREIESKYSGAIAERARGVNVGELASLVRSS